MGRVLQARAEVLCAYPDPDILQAGYGNICVATLRRWRAIYQEALGGALHEMGALKVGGRNEVVVLDELHRRDTSRRRMGIGVQRNQQSRGGAKPQIRTKGCQQARPPRCYEKTSSSNSSTHSTRRESSVLLIYPYQEEGYKRNLRLSSRSLPRCIPPRLPRNSLLT